MYVCVYVCACVRVCVFMCTCVFYFFSRRCCFFIFRSVERGEEEEEGGRGGKKKTRQNSTVPEKSFLSTSENRAEQLPRSAQDTLLLQFLGLRLVVGKTLRLPGRALLHVGGKGGGSDILDGHLLQ